MTEDGECGSSSDAQVASEYRSEEHINLAVFANKKYRPSNYSSTIEEWFDENEAEGSIICYYFLPRQADHLELDLDGVEFRPVRSRRELKDKLKALTLELGWSITSRNRMER